MATRPPTKRHEPFIFEMVEKTINMNDVVLKPVTGAKAFRKYSAILGPALNRSGNLRGMIINSKMRSVYKLAGEVGHKLAVVSALIAVAKEYSRVQKVWNSNASRPDTFSHITVLTSAAVLRSVTSIVPTTFSYAALSAEGYAMLFSLVTGNQSGNSVAAKLDAAQKRISEIHSRQWDGEVWYKVITDTVR